MLSIDVLGSVIIGDGRAKFSKKAQALLAYLACRNECVPRVILADLLWPYKEHNLALHSLRNCLVDTRKALGPLDSKSLQCGFTDCSLRDFRCDLHQIRNAIAGKIRFSETVALYRGPLLSGLSLVSEPWNEWLDLERERVKAMVIRTLLSYGEEALSFGNADAATDAAERVLSIDCASEPSYQLLIRAHKSIGRDSAAAIAYRRCCEVMRRDIGVAPDAETTRLIGGEVAAAAEWDLALAKSFPGEASRTYRDGFKLGYGRGMLRGYEKAIEALSLQGRGMLRGHEKAIEALSLNLARAKERLDIHH